jgi:hypothetical protein
MVDQATILHDANVYVGLLIAGFLLLAIQIVLAVALVRALRRLQPMEERVGHLGDAVTMLVETAESGFRATAAEVRRLVALQQPAGDGWSTPRSAAPQRRGRTALDASGRGRPRSGELRVRADVANQGTAAESGRAPSRTAPERTPVLDEETADAVARQLSSLLRRSDGPVRS